MGCCPDYDPDTGRQLNMICVCGAVLPINNRYSICDSCLRHDPDDPYGYDGGYEPEPEYDDDGEEYEPDDWGGHREDFGFFGEAGLWD
jgi:hypothetical protein